MALVGSIGGIASVHARIAALQSRAGHPTTTVNGPISMEVAGPSDPTAGFDAFGSVYQEALAAAGIVDLGLPGPDGSAAGAGTTGALDGAAGELPGSTGTGGGLVPAAAPVYGTGQIATFTPAEFASISGAAGQQFGDAYEPSAAATAVDPAATPLTPPVTSAAGGGYVGGSSASPPGSTIESLAASFGVELPGTLDGPVFTGASQRARQSPESRVTFTPWGSTNSVPTGQPGASIGKIGGYGPMPVPAELQVYGNGQIPRDALASIGQGGHQLSAPAAASWRDAVAAAAADGIDLRVTDSYRSYDEQVDLAHRKGLYRNGGWAAVPGTSNHGWGMAVDVDVTDPATMSWMKENAWRFGWVEAVPREPWHWEFRPQQA